MRELTVRSVLLGGAITLVFTAANVYFGLKVGLTFGTALPAAVISMALLRFFAGNSIVENNIVQTIASAAGAVATMIFILPGLVMVGWWQSFPYWTTVAVCFLGGTLGVMLSVPLRRAMVTGSDLPYPEGVAGAEVLKVGAAGQAGEEESRQGLSAILRGSLLAAFYSLLAAFKLVAGEFARTFKLGAGATGVFASMQLSLLGIGHLIGLSSGLAILAGMLLAWGVLEPILVARSGLPGTPQEIVGQVFGQQVRFIGAGAIAVAALWTLVKIARPIASGIAGIIRTQRARAAGAVLDRSEQDLPGWIVAASVVAAIIPIAWLLWDFAQGGPVAERFGAALSLSLFYILVIGALVGAVTGYMAGLIGTSNSPVSGVGIIAAIVAALAVLALFGHDADPARTQALVAYTLFVTAVVLGIALIANDNLQDLKTGQLVGSTPWKQQVALVIGVGFGSLVVPPTLELLNHTFGFAGAPGAGANALPAPQASLISSLVKGVLGGDLRWDLIGIGAAIGAGVVLVDELLGRAGRMRLPPLGVALGMYLPMSVTLMTPIGAVIGHFWDRRADRSARPEHYRRLGVLLATGMIVGDSLFGIAFAGAVAGLGDDPLALVGPGFAPIADWLGLALLAALAWWGYQRTRRDAE